MILSKKFVSDFIDLPDIDIKKIADAMLYAGNEYDEARKLVNATNLVIGEVIECEKHPEADKLNVTKVNIGTEVLDIVCGAPNCRKGIKVIVAKVGAVLPEIEIKASNIRGVSSNGMLCSLVELGIDTKFLKEDAALGIHELGEDACVGEDPIKYLGFDDEIIDFELTSNRGDLLSVMGMAYELGAIYEKKIKVVDSAFKTIDRKTTDEFKLDIKTEDCPLFLARKAVNVEIKESPEFIKTRLIASGIRPINNVVDISNYVMIETGQPLHFYDADRLGDIIVVRNANKDEKLITLDNNERILDESDIVIADNKTAIGLAGVMGGLSTEVESDTKNIIIESAIFDSVKVRKTSKKILRSEASNRFEKGLDPKRTYLAMDRACHLLEKYAGAKILDDMCVHDKTKDVKNEIKVNFDKVYKVLGMKIEDDKIINILLSLGFEIKKEKDYVVATIPSRRLDLKIEEDLIEEIGRIYGIDNIESKLPTLAATVGSFDKTKREIRNKMISFGLNETLSHTLIPKEEVYKYTTDKFTHIMLADPMSSDKSALRYSLIHSLKEVYLYNKARNLKDVSIFEIGKGFYKEDTYKEDLKLACLMTGIYQEGINKEKADFYTLKGILEELLDYLGFAGRYTLLKDENIAKEFHPGQSASIIMQGKIIGVIGKLHPSVIKDDLYVFEINLEKLLINKASKMQFKEISKFPSIKKDLAFIMKKDIEAGSVASVIKKSGGKLLTNIEVFDVYVGENLNDDEKSIAYALTFADQNKTLTEEEVMDIFNKIIDEVTSKCKVTLRDK